MGPLTTKSVTLHGNQLTTFLECNSAQIYTSVMAYCAGRCCCTAVVFTETAFPLATAPLLQWSMDGRTGLGTIPVINEEPPQPSGLSAKALRKAFTKTLNGIGEGSFRTRLSMTRKEDKSQMLHAGAQRTANGVHLYHVGERRGRRGRGGWVWARPCSCFSMQHAGLQHASLSLTHCHWHLELTTRIPRRARSGWPPYSNRSALTCMPCTLPPAGLMMQKEAGAEYLQVSPGSFSPALTTLISASSCACNNNCVCQRHSPAHLCTPFSCSTR